MLRLAPVAAMVESDTASVAIAAGRSIRSLSLSTKTFGWMTPDLGGTVTHLVQTPTGFAALAGTRLVAIDKTGVTAWSVSIGKTRVSALAADSNFVYVGGDQNTNTGFEPYRSPYVFRYRVADGMASSDWQLYNWSGPDVRANGKMLQADSFVNRLRVDPSGKLWMCAGSDGGNTVLTKAVRNLDETQTALSGSCYSGPCFGYKGAKKTGMFARIRSDAPELERATWVIPYLAPPNGRNTPPCGCKGPPANPNSMTIEDVGFFESTVVAAASVTYRPPESDNAWFRDTVYTSGMTWVGILDRDLKQMSMGTLIPGTKGPAGSAVRGGRVLIFGSAADTSKVIPGPGETGWATALPVKSATQVAYGGGATDGYFMLACLSTAAECGGPIPATDAGTLPSDDAGQPGPGTGSFDAGAQGPGGAGMSDGGNGLGETPRGCGCSTGVWSSMSFLIALMWRRGFNPQQ